MFYCCEKYIANNNSNTMQAPGFQARMMAPRSHACA